MKKYAAIGLVALLAGCSGLKQDPEIDSKKNDSEVSIASFNIQIFGKSKLSKPHALSNLVNIVTNYDMIAIQELRDKSETTLPEFVKIVEFMTGREYEMIQSERLGRSSSKEQYGFMFDSSIITFSGDAYVSSDEEDVFEREPYVANFKAGEFDFTLVNIHTKPTDAKSEIMALEKVLLEAQAYFTNDNDVIVLGDFNSDGSYFSEKIKTGIRGEAYSWIIGDEVDTTVAKSDNTYDRIVFDKSETGNEFRESGVFYFDQEYGLSHEETKTVSDHYPVWATFSTHKDDD